MKATMKRLIVFFAGLSLLSTTFMGIANAAMVGTQSAVAMEERSELVGDIKDLLTREDVRKQLVGLGVDPADAGERISAMTASELRTLQQGIGELPAGAGAIEVIGIVFLVLLILEIAGVTNFFSRF